VREEWRAHSKAYDGSFTAADIVAIFLFLFPPWEVEQLACVCDYAEERYRDIFASLEAEITGKLP